jgi:hypothetical protein
MEVGMVKECHAGSIGDRALFRGLVEAARGER